MAKVLICGRIHPAGRSLLEARADVEVVELLDGSEQALVEAIGDVDGVLLRTNPLRSAAVERAAKLRVVSRHGVGYDNVDVEACTRRRIPVTVVGDVNAVTVAEHALGMMLTCMHQLRTYDAAMRVGNYAVRDTLAMRELWNKTLLIVGFGRIGSRVAKRAAAFDMKIVVADPYVPRNTVTGLGYRHVADFREALGEADIVTLHMPGRPDGSPVMGAAEFAALKEGAVFINCARGSLVDEPALVSALGGRLRAAGLDVTRQEPPPDDHPLLKLENVVLSPHSAGSTVECFARMAQAAAQNILDAIDGRLDPHNVVNPEALGRN